MASVKKSSPSKYNDVLIIDIIYQHKKQHDGNAPTIRELIEIYGDLEGIYASTSVMRNNLRRICKNNGWTYTMRGVETNGEWKNGHPHS